MDMSKINIDVPEQLVSDLVRAEIARALGKKEELVEAVVKSAFSMKAKSYGSETIFEEEVKKMILEEAKQVFHDWLKENREMLREKLLSYLNARKQKRLHDLCEAFCRDLSNRFLMSLSIRFKEKDIDG